MSPRKKRPPTSDALEILHRRYYEGHPERTAGLERAREELALDDLRDILLLVDEEVSLAWLKRRSKAERAELLRWAGKVHARASDNPVRVPPRPACLPPRRLEERCPTCGQRTLARVVEDVTLWPGRPVKQLAHLRCDGCGERIFDVAATDRILKVQPRAKGRVAARLKELRRELDRRRGALDRSETVDPAAVKAELAARSRARRQALRPGTAHLTPHEVVERRVRKAGRKKP